MNGALRLADGRDLLQGRGFLPGGDGVLKQAILEQAIPFQTPDGASLGRLVFGYRRMPGTTRIEGSLTLERFECLVAGRPTSDLVGTFPGAITGDHSGNGRVGHVYPASLDQSDALSGRVIPPRIGPGDRAGRSPLGTAFPLYHDSACLPSLGEWCHWPPIGLPAARYSCRDIHVARKPGGVFTGLAGLHRGAHSPPILNALLYFAFVLSVVSVVQYFSGSGKIFWLFPTDDAPALGPFVNRDQYAAFIELVLPLGLLQALGKDSRARGFAVVSAAMYASVIAGASRAGALLVTAEVLLVPLALWIKKAAICRYPSCRYPCCRYQTGLPRFTYGCSPLFSWRWSDGRCSGTDFRIPIRSEAAARSSRVR